jgi:hypothetical protein
MSKKLNLIILGNSNHCGCTALTHSLAVSLLDTLGLNSYTKVAYEEKKSNGWSETPVEYDQQIISLSPKIADFISTISSKKMLYLSFDTQNDKNNKNYNDDCTLNLDVVIENQDVISMFSNCDVIVYVIDINSASSDQRAIDPMINHDLLSKINDYITSEYKNGHYVKLIPIVNKIDEINDECYKQFYNEIVKNTILNPDDFFRVSSHKMYINSLIKHKLNVKINPDIKKEINKRFKTANVFVSKQLKDNIHKNGVLNHKDILFQEDICDDEKSFKYELMGDWDNVINSIKILDKNMPAHTLLCLSTYRDVWLKTTLPQYNGMNNFEGNCIQHYNELLTFKKMLNDKLPENKNKLFEDLLITIIENTLNIKSHDSTLIEIIFQHIYITDKSDYSEQFIHRVIQTIFESKNAQMNTLLFMFLCIDKNKIDMSKYYKKILSSEIIYNKPIIFFCDIVNNSKEIIKLEQYHSRIIPEYFNEHTSFTNKILNCGELDFKESKIYHDSWYITILLNSKLVPTDLMSLVKISITPLDSLFIISMNNKISREIYTLIDNKCDNIIPYFKYYVYNAIGKQKCLKYNIFRIVDFVNRTSFSSDYELFSTIYDLLESESSDNVLSSSNDSIYDDMPPLIDIPSDEPADGLSDKPTEGLSDKPTEGPSDKPLESPSDKPLESPSDKPTKSLLDKLAEDLLDKLAEGPSDKPLESPSDKLAEGPSDKPLESPSDKPTKSLLDKLAEDLSDKPTESLLDNSFDCPSNNPSEGPSDKPSEGPSDKLSDGLSNNPSNGSSNKPSDDSFGGSGEDNDSGFVIIS